MDFSNMSEGHVDGEESMVFHYNREERIKNAPQSVQDYYAGKLGAFKPGLFRALVSTKGNRFIFMTLVICFLLVIFVGIFGPKKNVDVLAGVRLDLSVFVYADFGDNVYVDLKLDPPAKKMLANYEREIPVKVTFSAVNAEGQIAQNVTVVDKYNGKELFDARAKRLSEIREEKKRNKYAAVKGGDFFKSVKTSFADYDIVSVNAEVEINGEVKTVSSPVKNLTSLIR